MSEKYINFIPNEEKPYLKQEPKPKKRRFWILAVFLIFFVSCTTYAFMPANMPEDPEAYDPQTLEPIAPDSFMGKVKKFIFSKEKNLQGTKDDRINLLLMGIGGEGHDGGSLADTIMIVSVKPSTKQIALISVPRDLAVKMKDDGVWKINYANYLGEKEKKNYGPVYMSQVIKESFGLDIHYYARVDFKAFTEIIDNIGGIRVNVDKSFTDTEYPAANYLYQVVNFTQGDQVMNGDIALKFARSRHGNNGEGSDFARAKRQQKVILAVKEKIFSFGTLANPVRINKILQTLDKNIATNLELSDIITFLRMAKELDTTEITNLVLDNSTGGYLKNSINSAGAYILEPVTGNFEEISNAMKNIFDKNAQTAIRKTTTSTDNTPLQEAPVEEIPNIEIKNGTWRPGLAARTRDVLKGTDYTITEVGNTNERPHMQSGIYNIEKNLFLTTILENIANKLQIPMKQDIPLGETTTTGTDILIILGEDFNEETLSI